MITILSQIGSVLLWTLISVLIAVGGLKIFDFLTPGKLEDHVFVEKNLSASIVYATVFLGLCIIIASAIH